LFVNALPIDLPQRRPASLQPQYLPSPGSAGSLASGAALSLDPVAGVPAWCATAIRRINAAHRPSINSTVTSSPSVNWLNWLAAENHSGICNYIIKL
jgi:hypothetical protein